MPKAPDTYSLTRAQMTCMQVIQELTDAAGGVAPSYAEISREMDMGSRSGVHRLIAALEARGYLARLPFQARTLTILARLPMPDFTPYTWSRGARLGGQEGVGNA